MSQTPSDIAFDQLVLHASLSGDVNTLVGIFTDDAILMPPNDATVYGKDEIRSWWEEYFTFFRVTSSVQTEREVTAAGNQAFDRACFSVTIIPKQHGPRIRDDIRTLNVWRQEPDGTWKISHQLWNSTKPVGAGTNRYMTRMLQKKTPRPG
jgi:ketosteroid isomerase-like protein